MFSRILFVVLSLVLISGCAVVTDKGKLSEVSEYDKSVCDQKTKAVVFVEKDITRTFWGKDDSNSYTYKRFQESITKRFMNSGCFSSVDITPVALSNPPSDSLYITMRRDVSYGGFPFRNLIAIVIPIQTTNTLEVDAIVEYNNNKTAYSIEDYYKDGTWSVFILLYPFMDDPVRYKDIKNKDVIDALILSMKNDGILKNIEVKKTTMMDQ
jgi:hypothetical protein